MVNFGPWVAEIAVPVWGTPAHFNGFWVWLRYCTNVAQWSSTKLCTMLVISWAGTVYIHFWGLLPPNRILLGAKFAFRPSLAFCYICRFTAWHSSSGHQPNFAAFSRGCHPYLAGRPSRWASAHILVFPVILRTIISTQMLSAGEEGTISCVILWASDAFVKWTKWV